MKNNLNLAFHLHNVLMELLILWVFLIDQHFSSSDNMTYEWCQ